MAVSATGTSYGSYASTLNLRNNSSSSGTCVGCGRTTSTSTRIGQSYSNYSGRTGADSYVCATCQNKTTSNSSTYGSSVVSTKSYCPSCNKTHSSAVSHWSGGSSSAGAASTKSSTSASVSPSWAR